MMEPGTKTHLSRPVLSKAVLLAAGLGTRLRPLTYTVPKPLLPLDGILIIDHQLRYLASQGIQEVVINIHHLGDNIRQHVGNGSRFGLKVGYSEEPTILGTGGGIKKAAAAFGPETFVVLNSDALIDATLTTIMELHLSTKARATMVLRKLTDSDDYTPVALYHDGFVAGFGTGQHFFSGLQILGPEMLDTLPPAGRPACIIEDGYRPLMDTGAKVAAFIHQGRFNDVGTLARYEQVKRDVAQGRFHPLV